MTSELLTMTDLERNTLLTFDPYDDGVTIDPDRLAPEVLWMAKDLSERGLLVVTDKSDGSLFIQVTEQGRKVTQP